MNKLIAYIIAALILLPPIGEIVIGVGNFISPVAAAEIDWHAVGETADSTRILVDQNSYTINKVEDGKYVVRGIFEFAGVTGSTIVGGIDAFQCLNKSEGPVNIVRLATPDKIENDWWTTDGHRSFDVVGRALCDYVKSVYSHKAENTK